MKVHKFYVHWTNSCFHYTNKTNRILQQFNYWDQNNKNYQARTLVVDTEFLIKGNNSTHLY